MLLLFGVIQYGLYFYGMQSGTAATSDALRRLTVAECQTSTDLRNYLDARLGAAQPGPASGITATVTYKKADQSPASAPGEIGGNVSLTVSFSTINLNLPFVPIPNSGTVQRTVYGRVEDLNSTTGCFG